MSADPVPTQPVPTQPVPTQPVPTQPVPTQPVPTQPSEKPAPEGEASDPWAPPEAPAAPDKPAPDKPVPDKPMSGEAADPWSVEGLGEPVPTRPAPTQPIPSAPEPRGAGEDEDPWSPGGAGEAPPKEPAVEDDPWQAGGAGEAPPADAEPASKGEYVSADRQRRAMEQVTRLLDRPGAKDVCGYPEAIVRADDAGMALTPGTKPVLLVFFDDGVRASDLQAAQLLPMIVRLRGRIDFVPLDRGTGAKRTRGADELALRYLDQVPTVVVLDAQRTTRLTRSGRVDASRVEKALLDALANPGEASDATPAEAPAAPGHAIPASPGDPSPVDPFARPPTAEPAEPEERGGVTFTPPSGYSARAHADRLRSAPGDKVVPGYPATLLPSAPAGRALGTGSKPCVILFYDNASKASDLQAAAYLELLVRRKNEIDLVLVDVGTQARWDADQKRVVRTFYNFYVPTTVVLTASRAPVKAWYSRVAAATLSKAIDQALQR